MIDEWTYRGKAYDAPEEKHIGFVYCITDLSTSKMYIGKKKLWVVIKRPPLKGQKRFRKITKQSDWKNYFGSSEAVKAILEERGRENFTREILYLCETLGEMSYVEAYEQMRRGVLLSDEYYNEFIGCKIHGKHLSKVREKLLKHYS